MRYRDIEYSVVQGIKRGVWKWSVSVAGTVISGRETSKAAAVVTVEKAINQALIPKRARLVQPRAPRRPRKVSERSGAIPTTKAQTVDALTVGNYRNGPRGHLVKVTSQMGRSTKNVTRWDFLELDTRRPLYVRYPKQNRPTSWSR